MVQTALAIIANAVTATTLLVSAAVAIVSWLKEGTVYKFFKLFDKVDHIQSEVVEVNDWTRDAEVVFIELAREDTDVSPEGVKDLFDVEETRSVILHEEEEEEEEE